MENSIRFFPIGDARSALWPQLCGIAYFHAMEQNTPDTIDALVTLIESFAGRPIKRSADFATILRHVHATQQFEWLGDIAFHGNFLVRVLGTLQRAEEADHREKLEQEFSRAMEDFHRKLVPFASGMPSPEKERFEQSYIELSHDAVRGLVDLADGLFWLKEWETTMNEQDSGG
jgi:hypothetical protein